MKFYTKKSVKV